MDPNQALKNARKALARFRADETTEQDDNACELVDAFEALDEWLTKGGFMPDAWYQRRGAIAR